MKKSATLFLLLLSFSMRAQDKAVPGIDPASVSHQLGLEKTFDSSISVTNIGNTIKELSSAPHHIGSPGGSAVAKKVEARFKEYGWDARIETYQVLFPTPVTRVLEIPGNKNYKALLKEPALKEDNTSGQQGQLPTYNCWSADGDVTAPLVFVNFGLPEDYERLEVMGISVKDKIVIAKYGRSWRGIKPKIAQEHGAIGCIIYSDPHEDGYFQGEVYPKGAFKNEFGVQRGSVMDMVVYPGDPLTPGKGAVEGATRLERSQALNLLKIPVLPISYHDAQPLLELLDGPVVPADWRGALPITYHVGPGRNPVHLKLAFDWKLTPAMNVIATMKGTELPDEWVIRGNHHDAWVNGACDPISGLAALLEEARVIGEMAKHGVKPKRTLIYCAWDGEEPGLMGSTEWVEDHEAELQQKTVAYINTDDNGRGFVSAGGSQALEPLVNDILRGVKDPQTNVSVWERARAALIKNAATTVSRKTAIAYKELPVSPLGSGSDYTSFLQHAGIPTLALGFGGENEGGEYHSIYDSYDDFTRFKDPGFFYEAALARVAGKTMLRLANAEVLPFDFRSLHKAINTYLTEIITLTDQEREKTAVDNQAVRSGVYQLADDPKQNLKAPKLKAEVPYLNFSPLQNALIILEKAANRVADTVSKRNLGEEQRKKLNESLYKAEQQLLMPNGLPRRQWFKHSVYAPGFYTGYGVKTLPGIREAIEQRNWKEAQEQIAVVAQAVTELGNYLMKL